MPTHIRKYTSLLAILVCLLLPVSLEAGNVPVVAKDRRTFALGSGGTNYSKLHRDRQGLYKSVIYGKHNLFGAWGDGAYTAIKSDVPQLSLTPGGYSASGGLLYEFHYDLFRAQVGCGVRWQDVGSRVADTTVVNPRAYDSQGYPYRLQYDFTERTDYSRALYAVVPVMVGVEYGFYHTDVIYANAGVKFELPLSGSSRTLATGYTTGTYDQFIGIYEEMDNHGLRKEVPIDYRAKGLSISSSLDILLSAEIGYERIINGYLRSPKKRTEERVRVGLFFEYGLTNIVPNCSRQSLIIPEDYKWDFPAFEFNHLLTTMYADHHRANKLYAGIRFTILIGVMTDTRCVLCGPYRSEADM